MKTNNLRYGECPSCGQSCQPPDRPENGLEYCFCCDCKIMWRIIHTDETVNAETWMDVWNVQDIETFEDEGFVPFECEDN